MDGLGEESTDDCSVCTAIEGSLFEDVGKRERKPGLYYLSHLRLNSYDAEYACKRIKSRLAEIDTPTQLQLIASGLEGLITNDEDIHIGGKVNFKDQTISSRTRTNHLLYADWEAGQPDGKGREDCVTLQRIPRKAFIKMNDCNTTSTISRFLCQMSYS